MEAARPAGRRNADRRLLPMLLSPQQARPEGGVVSDGHYLVVDAGAADGRLLRALLALAVATQEVLHDGAERQACGPAAVACTVALGKQCRWGR